MLTVEQKIEILKELRDFIDSEEFSGMIDGICLAIRTSKFKCRLQFEFSYREYLLWFSDILHEERKKAAKAANDMFPVRAYFPYYWKPGLKEPRIKWVNQQLEKLEKK